MVLSDMAPKRTWINSSKGQGCSGGTIKYISAAYVTVAGQECTREAPMKTIELV